jgi:hypothetical protein
MTNQPIQNPPTREGEWVNLNSLMNDVELLATTENQCESTEAEEGCGGRLGDGNGDCGRVQRYVVEDRSVSIVGTGRIMLIELDLNSLT